MLVSDFDFELPDRLIAQEPVSKRDSSRILVVDRARESFSDSIFTALPDHLRTGDVLVVNNTRVFPARLIGRRMRTSAKGAELLGGRVEVFLVKRLEPLVWEALVKPGRALLPGARVEFARGRLTAEILEWRESGRRVVRFEAADDFDDIVDRIGRTPLPPYIKRDEEDRLDAQRYQTIFARERGAVAAPTAGLHFTPSLMQAIRDAGVGIVEITLHVGYGTFQPVRVEQVEEHHVEPEAYEISREASAQINAALAEGRRIVAVGTTTTRALESAALIDPLQSGISHSDGPVMTDLFIYPGFKFNAVRALVTNFHLPKSSLLMLVSAFGGRDLILRAYRHAVAMNYRFYSYGDAMFIV